ncbi:putative AC transposase, partial [Glycine soja]
SACHKSESAYALVTIARVCGLCSSADHHTDLCPSLQQSGVNEQYEAYAVNIYNRPPQQQNQQQQNNYDLSSNRYNPGKQFEVPRPIAAPAPEPIKLHSTPEKEDELATQKRKLSDHEGANKNFHAGGPSSSSSDLQQPPIPLPFPPRAIPNKKMEEVDEEILETFRKVEVNIPLLDAIKQIPRYAKFLKELCTHKRRLKGNERISMGRNVSALIGKYVPHIPEDRTDRPSPFSFNFEPHQPHVFDWTSSLTLSPSRPPSVTVAPRQTASLSLKTLTLDLEPSPFSFDFKPQHQPHIFNWTSSLTISPSRPPSTAPRHPHPPPHTKHVPLWLCVSMPPLISFSTLFLTIDMETRKESINKLVSSSSMSNDENEDKSSHEEMQSQFVEPSGSSKRPRSLRVVEYLNPDVTPFTRNTGRGVLVKKYMRQKADLKEELASIPNRISLTCDLWTNCNTEGFICLTAHYVDSKWNLQSLLMSCARDEDEVIKRMAEDMMLKFDKYWDEYNVVLAFGAAFDPRIKFESLGFCYKKTDPLTWEMKVEKVKRKLYELWNFYASKPKSSSSSVKPPSLSQDFDLLDDLIEYNEQVASDSGKSQLDTYLEEVALNLHFTAHMDVVDWWKTNSPRFPHLSIMACDLLSILVTTVASKSPFSIGSRILNKYRNRLSSDCVEAIIFTCNWKHGFNEDDDDLFDEDSIVKATSSNGASNVVDVD